MRLTIDQTWNGEVVGAAEEVVVSLVGARRHLMVQVDAPFHGDPAPDAPAGSHWGLWEHEVVELFVLGGGGHYLEVELGPHGHYLVLQLGGYRHVLQTSLALDFAARIDGDRWRGLARIDRSLLPEGPHKINAYAIHGVGDARRYLAWSRLQGEKPDFHLLNCFVGVTLP
ncbi:MAG: hypothetical protein GY884_04390 [Proteobacteria bacterium]|nr:hypothetical protein [Pseudomonadota bacterium]